MARSSHGTAARAVPAVDPRLPIDEYVRSLLQAFDVGVILHGPRAEVRFANKAALEMSGMTQEQMSGQTSRDLGFIVLQEDGTECPFSMRPVPRAIESRQPVIGQVLGWRRPGSDSVLWTQVTAVPQFASDGTLTGVVNTLTNITTLKDVEAALRRAGELNHQILLSAQEGIAVHDRELRYTLWNPYMERMSGLKAADVIGKRPHELFPFLAEEGIYADLEKALAGKIISSHDTPYIIPQTNRRGWTNNNFAPLRDDKGEIIGVVATVRDITERKHEDEQLRKSEALLSQAEKMTNFGSWERDLKTGKSTLSRNLLQIYGLASEADWDREEYWARIHPEDSKRARANVDRAITACEPFEYIVRYRAPDGTFRVHSLRAIQVPGADGRTERSIGVAQDITDQTRKEEDLRQLSARLLQSQDEERRRIARDLHDSASQKLLAISLSLAQLGKSADVRGKRGKQVLADTRKMVKDLSKEIRSLSYLLHPPLLDELGLASAVEEYVKGFSQRSGLNLEFEMPADIGRLSSESETALFRIVQEALGNIQKHSGSSKGRIRLTKENGEIVLEITDSGRGARAEDLQDREVRASALGVGILGMRERMRQLGGRLDISLGSRGTTVRAMVPLRADIDNADANRHGG